AAVDTAGCLLASGATPAYRSPASPPAAEPPALDDSRRIPSPARFSGSGPAMQLLRLSWSWAVGDGDNILHGLTPRQHTAFARHGGLALFRLGSAGTCCLSIAAALRSLCFELE